MKKYTRHELDYLGASSGLTPILDEDGDLFLVNGMLGEYKLWYPKSDRSVLPCLTGVVGGMPGAWENWITAWHTQHLDEFDSYMDIGANGGYFAFLAASRGLTVIAVEANPEYVEVLERSAAENEINTFFAIENLAVSDSNGFVKLVIPEELHGGASIAGRETNLPGKTVKVLAVTLDEFGAPEGERILIKMDIEGAEQMAFRGASEFNEKHKPTYIIEYTPRHYEGDFFAELLEYGVVTMVDFYGGEAPVTREQAEASPDWITLVVRPHGEK